METDLFTWASWDLLADTMLQFYGCVLKVPIGEFKIGATVPIILVDFENGILQLFGQGRVSEENPLFSEHKVRMVIAD